MKVLGMAGGSGTGKSTISYRLVDAYPDIYELVNLDNYQKVKGGSGLPKLHGMPNWDHPDVVDWDRLRGDIQALRDGQTITTSVWNHRTNPDFYKHKQMKDLVLKPKPVIVVEGHLALHEQMRDLYDKTVFLDLDESTRNQRRADGRKNKGFIGTTDAYMTQVLAPMHKQYVEPTKETADVVIEVSKMTIDEAILAVHAVGKELL